MSIPFSRDHLAVVRYQIILSLSQPFPIWLFRDVRFNVVAPVRRFILGLHAGAAGGEGRGSFQKTAEKKRLWEFLWLIETASLECYDEATRRVRRATKSATYSVHTYSL